MKTMKFKVGDKVKTKVSKHGANPAYNNTEGTISVVSIEDNDYRVIFPDGVSYWYIEDELIDANPTFTYGESVRVTGCGIYRYMGETPDKMAILSFVRGQRLPKRGRENDKLAVAIYPVDQVKKIETEDEIKLTVNGKDIKLSSDTLEAIKEAL